MAAILTHTYGEPCISEPGDVAEQASLPRGQVLAAQSGAAWRGKRCRLSQVGLATMFASGVGLQGSRPLVRQILGKCGNQAVVAGTDQGASGGHLRTNMGGKRNGRKTVTKNLLFTFLEALSVHN